MVDYSWAKQEYIALDYAEKKARLSGLFEIFKEQSVTIQEMIPLLVADQMKENEMVQAYNNLIDAMGSVKEGELQKSFDKMDQLRIQMDALRKQEADDRAQEHPEDLLKNL